jgi:hypothetical protein
VGEAKQRNMFDRAFSRTFLGLTWIEIGERIGMGFARVGCEGANGESLLECGRRTDLGTVGS